MKRAEHQPETVSVKCYGGIYYKVYRVPDLGTVIPQHSHDYDHLTALLQGSVRVWRDGRMVGDFAAPASIEIPAYCKHAFHTVTDNVVLACIHNADRLDAHDEPHVHDVHDLELED